MTSQTRVVFRHHRIHEMQTIVTDVCGVCQSVHQSVCHVAQLGGACSLCRSFGAAFAKSLWLLVTIYDPHMFKLKT